MEFGADAPAPYFQMSEQERLERCELTSDVCLIDGSQFYVHGCVEIPVHDAPQPFTWGVWTSVSAASMKRMASVWETIGREAEPPCFGWLCTALPLYPETLLLRTHVHLRPVGQRPFVELEPTNHPLAIEQRNGITRERVRRDRGSVAARSAQRGPLIARPSLPK